MRTPSTNPFEPGSDRIPAIWAGRIDALTDWERRVRPRRVGGLYERGRVLVGEPGIGKSVLVRRIAAEAAAAGDLVTPQVRIPRGSSPFPLVAEAVLGLADQAGLPTRRDARLGGLLDRVRRISLGQVGVELAAGEDRTPAHAALSRLLVAVGEVAAHEGRAVVVHLDEVQNVTDDEALSQLLIALGDVVGATTTTTPPGGEPLEVVLPVALYLTGLPEFVDAASTRAGATFSRRFATTVLGPLPDDDVLAALQPLVRHGHEVAVDGGTARVRIAPDAAQAIVERCLGDPFLFQLAGQQAWDAGEGPVVTAADVASGWAAARSEARRHVQRQLDRLPDLERRLVEAMAALDPDDRTATRIARELGYERASQIGTTAFRLDELRGLIDRGKPYRFRVRTVERYVREEWP